MMRLENDWGPLLQEELQKPYFAQLLEFIEHEYNHNVVYPGMHDIFNSLQYTSFADTKVVLLGQDPYHGPGQAHGLSFSVRKEVPLPPSLRNMLKELADDLGCAIPRNGCLEAWARQGVLLLNTVLTVREGQAGSHRGKGWERFTDKMIALLNEKTTPVVFILWGSHAQTKASFITSQRHLILTAPHPSPLSAYRGFFGSKPYSTTNAFLEQHGFTPIRWQLEE
ncbi:uracil-DNA glycosylase [Paenibacillus turpanensis]|uniref:uracil-DNA glycosylase n=1 Tax=Paenibacillus turpanensis TaxID=2689078 RepID=UPI00140CCC8F|nr:uracil-DNA glycosylase [Paenibacillus turpanensis]